MRPWTIAPIGRCIERAMLWRVPDQKVGATYFVCHTATPRERATPIDFASFVAVPRLQGAAANTRFGGKRDTFCTSSAVKERGMRLPSDLGAATTNHLSLPGFHISGHTTACPEHLWHVPGRDYDRTGLGLKIDRLL